MFPVKLKSRRQTFLFQAHSHKKKKKQFLFSNSSINNSLHYSIKIHYFKYNKDIPPSTLYFFLFTYRVKLKLFSIIVDQVRHREASLCCFVTELYNLVENSLSLPGSVVID